MSATSEISIESETRGGFPASFGRGDPCTQYPSQSWAQRTTLLSVRVGGGVVEYLARYFTGEEAGRNAAGR
jgi:hypothetical protein